MSESSKTIRYGRRPLYISNDIFIIGDVTGDNCKLESLLKKLPLKEDSFIVFVGDIIGHGPDSLNVLQTIKNLKRNRKNVYVIKGNHDEHFLKQLNKKIPLTENSSYDWNFIEEFYYVGLQTLDADLIKKYLEKMNLLSVFDEMIPYFETKYFIATHAAICPIQWRFGKYDLWNVTDEQIISRSYPLDNLYYEIMAGAAVNESNDVTGLNKFLVCGHQLEGFKHDKPRLFEKRCFLDCGVGYRKDKQLFAMHYPSKTIFSS